MHNCFQLPPEYRCAWCRHAAENARRMAGNSIRAAATNTRVPDAEWCALLNRCGVDMVALITKDPS